MDAYIRLGTRGGTNIRMIICPLCREKEVCYSVQVYVKKEKSIFYVNYTDPIRYIMCDMEVNTLRSLSIYLHKTLKRRRDALTQRSMTAFSTIEITSPRCIECSFEMGCRPLQ